MKRYQLPNLPYPHSALEPFISGKTMEIHHAKHHNAYVKMANDVVDKLEEARMRERFDFLASLERKLAFSLSGHVLHSLWWEVIGPKMGGQPQGKLLEVIKDSFGSFSRFKASFTETASSVFGSGWAGLVWDPLSDRLLIEQIWNHQSNVNQGTKLLMVLDVWEHSYYLDYQNRRDDFVKSVWSLWNWEEVGRRLNGVLEG